MKRLLKNPKGMQSMDKEENLERRISKIRSEIVSNVNENRTGQLLDQIRKSNKKLGFLKTGKQIIIIDRNHAYLDEIMNQVLPEICPQHIISYERHHLPHYAVHDGTVRIYTNLDPESDVLLLQARVKHPCSINEKLLRKSNKYSRPSTFHNKRKSNLRDIYGFIVVVKEPHQVHKYVEKIKNMPCFTLEKFQKHRKTNSYQSEHINLIYTKGSPEMLGLELEVQVTEQKSHNESINAPEQSHDSAYIQEKLGSSHQTDAQIIIVGNSITVPKEYIQARTEQFTVVQIPNKMNQYTLILPEY